MLGKLIKHEFKNTYKVMLAVYAAYILLTVLGSVSSYTMAKGYSDPNFFSVSVIIFYVLSCVAVYILTFVYICIRYYKTMYSAQGYLTHTLPAEGISIFNAKLIVSEIWMIISALLLVVSVFFFTNAASKGEIWNAVFSYSWSDFNERFYEEFDVSFVKLLVWSILGIIFGMLTINLWIFTGFAIGQLSDKHKVAISIVAAMGLYFVFQIFGVATVIGSFMNSGINGNRPAEMAVYINSMMMRTIGDSIIVNVLMYGTCAFINKRKLNLE